MPLSGQTQQRQEVRAFWTGPSLSLYEQLSLVSFVASGARVQLFSYDADLVVPDGVELVDAREILPGPIHGFRHASGDTSFALHSDLFRYVAIEKYGGWYVDVDIVFIGRALPASPIYVARETETMVNGAVMKFPAHAPILVEAIQEARRLLPATAASSSHEARLLIGPPLVTRLIDAFDLDAEVRPRLAAYEIGYDEVPAFFDPASCERLLERVADSDFTHLWNEIWRWVRIPKTYGPPEGSFLDSLFRRFGIRIAPQARLSYSAIAEWFREHTLLQGVKYCIGAEQLPSDALDQLIEWIGKSYPTPAAANTAPDMIQTAPAPLTASTTPHVLQTFWHGEIMGPYQLLCLRSFVDRGHQVEVFSYGPGLQLPGWLERRNAAEIIPQDKVLRQIDGSLAIHGNAFRYAVLAQRGGWWIDPDVVLLQPDLPETDIFFAGLDGFGCTSTALLKFPKGHEIPRAALAYALSLEDDVATWSTSGAATLTDLISKGDLEAALRSRAPLGPISWFAVPALFDPSQCEGLEEQCRLSPCLQLHSDVWYRSGVPQNLAPPTGSFLDRLFERHAFATRFYERMHFDEANRWFRHMYQSLEAR